MCYFAATPLILALMPVAIAWQIKINNWCEHDVFVLQSFNGSCASGPDGLCYTDALALPHIIEAGLGTSILALDIVEDLSASVKIATALDWKVRQPPILQFEYTVADAKVWWDLSNLDGAGAGLVGTPFFDQNVKVSPTGISEEDRQVFDTCVQLRCPAGEVCADAYNEPEQDAATRACPDGMGDMWIDLCQPEDEFYS